MKIIKPITNWLETRACAPTHSGWVLAGIAICFFGAGVNTMAGWLYVISGVSFALLIIAAFLAGRSLVGLTVSRRIINPVSCQDELTVELEIRNPTKRSVNLLQIEDILPFVLGKPVKQAIETIPLHNSYNWIYHHPTPQRGVYRWQTVELATGAPLGLFWCRRQHDCTAKAIVYPTVLTLTNCPIVDEIGQQDSTKGDLSGRPLQSATVGLTRSLRPYRTGDPIRLVHWRSSARYGELRVRELEQVTEGQDIIIALDSAAKWDENNFEQAVIAAASLYFYAQRQRLQVQLWTAATDLVKGDSTILETLAAVSTQEDIKITSPSSALIWLTCNELTLTSLTSGSRWLLWQNKETPQQNIVNWDYPGIIIESDRPLQPQLQTRY